jgi:hypothetical protein
MAHSTFVQVLNASDQFAIEFGSLLFSESGVSDNIVEEFTSIGILHDHEEFLFCFDNLVQLDHIGVTHLLQNFNFARDAFNVLLIVDLLFLQDFDGDLFTSEDVRALLHMTKSSFTESLA